MLLLKLITAGLLITIARQDFKLRAVYWWLFPLLLLALAGIKFSVAGGHALVHDFLLTGGFIGAQLVFLTLYFTMKEKRFTNIFEGYFGLGDLFFLICFAFYFSVLNYILFYVTSLLLIILLTLLNAKTGQQKIPLAGYQALFLLLVITLEIFTFFQPQSDSWLLKFYR